MKRLARYKYIFLMGTVLGLSSCDKGFEKLNTNPNASSKPNVDYLFTQSLLKGNLVYDRTYFYTSYLQCGNYVQHFSTAKEIAGAGAGDKYAANDFYQGYYYRYIYTNAILTLQEIITALKTPEHIAEVNKLSAARIWKVLLMQRITDLYGDVPYSEASQGRSGVFLPKYDAQADIYVDMLKELDEAIKAFDPSATAVTFKDADLLYKGNVASWKKFGYALMLRVAMRATKVTDGKVVAKDWVQKAFAGGVILQGKESAVIGYSNGPQTYNNNPVAFELVGQDYSLNSHGAENIEWGKYSKTWIDFLKNNNDPRLGVVSVVWNNNVPDTSAAIQKGMPNGSDKRTAEFVTFSEPNPATVLNNAAPLLILSNAETNLLLAEAALRGWVSGDKAQYYNDGVTAALKNWSLFGPAGVITDAKINQYVTAHALNVAGTPDAQMNQIHTQLWAALFLDEQEAYANWRRTGYPVLVPVNYVGNATGGTIPRRLPYSISEQGINGAHYQEAVKRQGPDLLTTRVWWDK